MTLRNADGTYELVVEPQIEKPERLNHDARQTMTKNFATILERFVNSIPEQWCSTHQQAWKTTKAQFQ
jgi:lauroyl/myristoyl acyltransferase